MEPKHSPSSHTPLYFYLECSICLANTYKPENPSSIPLGILNNFKAPYFLNTGIVYLDACFLLLD